MTASERATLDARAKRAAYMRDYYHRPEVKVKQKALFQAYYTRTREQRLAKVREWRLANPGKRRAITQRYDATPKGRLARVNHDGKRRARKHGGRVTKADLRHLLAEFSGICPLCNQPLVLGVQPHHFDHIVALANGGAHSTENLQVTHARCNQVKGAN